MFKKLIHSLDQSSDNRKKALWAIIIIIFILIILGLNFLFYADNKNFSQLSYWADLTKYQAVFLSNGQVYFGKITDVNSQTLVLEDIYYLRTVKDLQAGENATVQSATSTLSDNFSLIKLGNEIHGPESKMSINLTQVLFTEDLKNDSKVVEAIRAYENKK